jgi:hypothetical protein
MVLYVSEEIESVTIREPLIESDEVNGFLIDDVEGSFGVFC